MATSIVIWTVMLLLLLLLLLYEGEGFRYKNSGVWYEAHEHEGRLDVYGIEELQLELNENELLWCKEGAFSISRFSANSPSCKQLLESHTELQCTIHSITSLRPTLDCQILPVPDSYTTLIMHMNCPGYQYPTNKIKDGRNCGFELYLSSPFLGMEIAGHMFAIMMISMDAVMTLIKAYYGHKPVLRKFFCRFCFYFLYVPLLSMSYFLHSTVQAIFLFTVWLAAINFYAGVSIFQFSTKMRATIHKV